MAIWLGGAGGSPFAQADIGNAAQLNGTAFAFEVRYTPGTSNLAGYTWTLQGKANAALFGSLLFTNGNGAVNGKNATDPFNAIQLDAKADIVVGQSLVVTDLLFRVSVPVLVCGSLSDMNQTFVGPTPQLRQWLVADTDLSKVAWSLSGVVTAVRTTGGDETVKLDIYTKNISPTPTITSCNGQPCPVSIHAAGHQAWCLRHDLMACPL